MDIPQSFLCPALVREYPTAYRTPSRSWQVPDLHLSALSTTLWAGTSQKLGWVHDVSFSSTPHPLPSLPRHQIQAITRFCGRFLASTALDLSTLSTSTSVLLPLESVHICTGPSCYSPRCPYSEIFKNPVFSCHSFLPATLQLLPTAHGAKYGLRLRAAPSPGSPERAATAPSRAGPSRLPSAHPAGACPQLARALLLLLPLPGMPLPFHFASLTP